MPMTSRAQSQKRVYQVGAAGLVALALTAACGSDSGGGPANTGDGGSVEGVKLTVTPTPIHFGEVLLNTQGSPTTVTVQNIGNTASAPVTVAASDKVFRPTMNTCAGALNPGQSCTVAVAFVPEAVGPKV